MAETQVADTVVVRRPGEGEAYWMLDSLYEVKAAGSETNGRLTIMEMTIPAGMGPPPHIHQGGEAVYVLEGNVTYHIGEESFEGGPGSFFYVPEGMWENFDPQETVRLLVVYAPGGIDEFFADVGEPAGARELPPRGSHPPDLERLVAAAEKHGLQLRPPEE